MILLYPVDADRPKKCPGFENKKSPRISPGAGVIGEQKGLEAAA